MPSSIWRLRAARPTLASSCIPKSAASRRAPRERSFLKRTERRRTANPGLRPKGARSSAFSRTGLRPEQVFELSDLDLKLRINRPVRFQIHTSTRHDANKAGDVVDFDPGTLPYFAAARDDRDSRADRRVASSPRTIPVALNAKVNELGLLTGVMP